MAHANLPLKCFAMEPIRRSALHREFCDSPWKSKQISFLAPTTILDEANLTCFGADERSVDVDGTSLLLEVKH